MVSSIEIFKQLYLTHNKYYRFGSKWTWGVMAIKKYSTFPKAPELGAV